MEKDGYSTSTGPWFNTLAIKSFSHITAVLFAVTVSNTEVSRIIENSHLRSLKRIRKLPYLTSVYWVKSAKTYINNAPWDSLEERLQEVLKLQRNVKFDMQFFSWHDVRTSCCLSCIVYNFVHACQNSYWQDCIVQILAKEKCTLCGALNFIITKFLKKVKIWNFENCTKFHSVFYY